MVSGYGRRKESIARVFLRAARQIHGNKRTVDDYSRILLEARRYEPLKFTTWPSRWT